MSFWEQVFEADLTRCGIHGWVREHRFLEGRKFRFDFAFPEEKIAVEVEGGTWQYGRHNRPKGYEKDLEKYNLAVISGWRVLRFTSQQVERGTAVSILRQLLDADRAKS